MAKKLSSNVIKVVKILSDGQYHDGTTLGEKLQMTRSAIWKMIKKLESYNIKIDSIKGKGYALAEPLILLEPSKIKKRLNDDTIDVHTFAEIDSTNDYFKVIKHAKNIQICLAEQQLKGRGRLQRTWYSPFGKNIYFSCLYPFQKDVSELAGLSLVTSLAILNTLKNYDIKEEIYVKWPNDIYHHNKKLSGNLIEVQAETHGMCHAIIGIAINVNMLEDQSSITQPWTSVQKILSRYVDRNDLVCKLTTQLLSYLNQFEKQGFIPFIDEWMQADCLTNQTISVNYVQEKIKGKVTGINEQGHLLLRLPSGKIRAFSSGDTSIVKNN